MNSNNELIREALIEIIGIIPSDEQWAAIEAPLEPGLIVAGAGTGKTTVIAARIAWLIMSGQVIPDYVLGLTFTTKATSELQNRVRKYLINAVEFAENSGFYKSDQVGEPTILTYNAFGSRLLKEHALRLGLEPDARIVVDATRYQLAMRVVANTKLDLAALGYDVIAATKDVLILDEKLSNYLIEPDTLIETDERTIEMLNRVEKRQNLTNEMETTSKKRIALAQLVNKFRQEKIEADIYDYSDQIRLSAQAAQMSVSMQEMLRNQFKVVLLDEYQDTSVGQKVLLKSLFGNGHPVTAVGDPCQAIYGWRGAEITNMDSFPRDFLVSKVPELPARIFNLTGNRRSGERILDAANSLSAQLRDIHPIISPLRVADENRAPGSIQVGLLPTYFEEVDWVADQVASLDLNGNWAKVAILIRTNHSVGDFVKALEKRNVPVQVADAGALVDLPEVREVISYLELIADPTANTALTRILTGPRYAIGPRDLAILGRSANDLIAETKSDDFAEKFAYSTATVDRVERVCLLDALELVEESELKYSLEGRNRMSQLAIELRDLRKHSSESITELINRIVRQTGLGIQTLMRDQTSQSARFDRVAALLDLAGGYISLDGETSLRAFVTFLRDSERFNHQTEADISTISNAVTVMTVHKSKGLEFPIVVLPSITQEVFPSTTKITNWPKTPTELPIELKPKNSYSVVPKFPLNENPRSTDYTNYTKGVSSDRAIDERRLAYVAITRAANMVIASGSWWGPTQKNSRGPSEFLVELHKHATIEGVWSPAPEGGSTNPARENVTGTSWPQDVPAEIRAKLIAAKSLVESTSSDPKLNDADAIVVAEWDCDLSAIYADYELSNQLERTVKLPSNLTASQIINLKKDETEFLKSLVRPMPRQPSAAATRGTNFHAWVEEFFNKRALFDPDSLPGAGDSEIYSDSLLDQMKTAFKESDFADRTPEDLEVAFSLLVNGRTWLGRMDAIFRGTASDPMANGWLVVDWKTGKTGSADDLQLSIYRHALADLKGVDPEQVEAVFYHVTEKTIVRPQKLLTRSELENLI